MPTSATWPLLSQNAVIASKAIYYEQMTVERKGALFKMTGHDMMAPSLQSVAWVTLRDSGGREIQRVDFV